MSSIPRLPDELTVAHVAGIIAAGTVVVRLVAPAVITYFLAGLLRDTETASTWTLASANLANSIWPTILRTDSVHGDGQARTMIRVACKALPVMALLAAIAGVVTPLGLGEEDTALEARPGTFAYVQDDSAYGMGTSPRGQYELSRLCNGEHMGRSARVAPCPYSNSEVVYVDRPDGDGFSVQLPKGYNTTVPDEPRAIFSSGNRGSTVSNFFDIEWRQLSRRVSPNLNGTELAVGMFRQLDSVILEDKYKIVEGLIIDAKAGGIGFRNHTMPVGVSRGATWEEDLLFIEPSTSCVNTNLTLDFAVRFFTNGTQGGTIEDLVLTDRGGFFQLNTTLPELEPVDGQTNPDLQQRAYKAAWLNNAFTMLYLNVTNEKDKPSRGMKSFSYINSSKDKTFHMPIPSKTADRYEGLRLSAEFGNYLRLNLPVTNSSRGALEDLYPNPFNVSQADFASINLVCGGTTPTDRANMSNIYVACGLLRGAPQRVGEGNRVLFEGGSRWSAPLHACASSLRASVKTVLFSSTSGSNGMGLDGLSVPRITPKSYAAADNSDAPLWGLEDWGIRLDGFDPIWGIVSPEQVAGRVNVSTVRKAEFHLIGTSNGAFPSVLKLDDTQADNLAGASFAQAAMNTVFRQVAEADEVVDRWPSDLRGLGSLSIFRRWQDLSRDAGLAGRIVNLMWTDVASSAVVGTRGILDLGSSNPNSESEPPPKPILIHPIGTRITYDVRFGVPAALLLLWLAIIIIAAICSTCCGGRAGFATLRRRINQLSVGRVFTTFLYGPEQSTLTMSAKQWSKANGAKMVTLDALARREGDGAGEVYVLQDGADTFQLIEGQKR